MYEPHLIAANLSYVLMVWFFILTITKINKEFLSSAILFLVWSYYVFLIHNDKFNSLNFEVTTNALIMIDGVTALIMTTILTKDRLAWKHALILSFAVLCHIMILLNLKTQSAGFFYTWYDELIILVGLLQMGVSYNGFITSFSNLQKLLSRFMLYCHSFSKGLSGQTKRNRKT